MQQDVATHVLLLVRMNPEENLMVENLILICFYTVATRKPNGSMYWFFFLSNRQELCLFIKKREI
jgi:hypothetical protein